MTDADLVAEVLRLRASCDAILAALSARIHDAAAAACPHHQQGGGDKIIREVASKHSIDAQRIYGVDKSREVCRARWEAMSRMSIEMGLSSTQIGRILNRDHSTVVHGIRRAQGG